VVQNWMAVNREATKHREGRWIAPTLDAFIASLTSEDAGSRKQPTIGTPVPSCRTQLPYTDSSQMQLFPVVLAISFCILILPAAAASTTAVESSNADVVSLILWLICGILVGGIIAAARTRSAGPASK
jgi:hypothetical protein